MSHTVPAVKAATSTSKPQTAPLALDWSKVHGAKLALAHVGHKSPKRFKRDSDESYDTRFRRAEDRIIASAARLRDAAIDAGASGEVASLVESRALVGRAAPVVRVGKVTVPANGKLGRAIALLSIDPV